MSKSSLLAVFLVCCCFLYFELITKKESFLKISAAQGPGGRKIQRVSDINAMGPSAPMPNAGSYMQPTPAPPTLLDPMANNYNPQANFNNGSIPMQTAGNYGYNPQPSHMASSQQPPSYAAAAGMNAAPTGFATSPAGAPNQGAANQFPQFGMFQQPIVQDMAMQYGQRLADQGKQLVENQFEKWVPVAKLKYYFAVDNNYVIHKLRLLFFPFTHRVSIKCFNEMKFV